MTKTRLEAFSDDVFAIVITLLILIIKLPEVDYSNLKQALIVLLPNVLSYVMSFLIIGVYWVAHHRSALLVTKIDEVFLWLNILLLLFVSFIPYPTSLLGKYPFKEIPIIIYGANLIAANVTGFIMLMYLKHPPELGYGEHHKNNIYRQIPIYIVVNTLYAAAMIIAGTYPVVSYAIYIIVMLALIFLYQSKALIRE
jgi:uncharacterized membrane protein